MKTEGEQPAQPVDKHKVSTEMLVVDIMCKYAKDWIDGNENREEQIAKEISEMIEEQFRESVSPSPERGESDGWISVKDRLPEIDQTVIIWDGEYIHESNYNYDYLDFKKRGKLQFNDFQDEQPGQHYGVTHWMPLPKPPKQ